MPDRSSSRCARRSSRRSRRTSWSSSTKPPSIKHLRPEANVGSLLDELGDKLGGAASIGERVRAAAANLSRATARELAYKAVYAVAVFDLETNPEERELENLVIEVPVRRASAT